MDWFSRWSVCTGLCKTQHVILSVCVCHRNCQVSPSPASSFNTVCGNSQGEEKKRGGGDEDMQGRINGRRRQRDRDSREEKGVKNMEEVYRHTAKSDKDSKNLYFVPRFMNTRRAPLKLSPQQITAAPFLLWFDTSKAHTVINAAVKSLILQEKSGVQDCLKSITTNKMEKGRRDK